MIAHLWKCLELLTPSIRRQWVGLIPLAVIAAGLEAAGAAAVFCLLSIIKAPERLADFPLLMTLFEVSPWSDAKTFGLVKCWYSTKPRQPWTIRPKRS